MSCRFYRFANMRLLPTGIYTPLPCFFKQNEDLDLDVYHQHVQYVAESGTVPVVSGTMERLSI
ncbi:hypothetical protein B0I35DRAFT_514804 [Stachybotrys elegans]|uniref:Uncharacterized protein n=1 Tax=Stachybotrys elegans TaxID=80388 RepID=A0A8K0WMH3_9HYPO|nr:hypothetical protein B0I35DRAFT_514804 [Stachybotrys elegans]